MQRKVRGSRWLRVPLSRRAFLAGGLTAVGVARGGTRASGVVRQSLRLSSSPFALGVASGEPTPDGFVLWTRLAPDPVNGGGMPR